MRSYLKLLVLAVLSLPTSTFAVTRTQVFSSALAYAGQTWTMAERNQLIACDSSTRIRTPFPVSSTAVQGVAYCWGSGHTLQQFLNGIAGSGYAGNNCTSSDNSSFTQYIPGTFGVDCSGLVTRTWGRSETHLGTSQLPGVSRAIPEIMAARRGDIFNQVGRHTAILITYLPDGTPQVIESAGDVNKVIYRTQPWSYFNGYTARVSDTVTDNIGGEVRVDTGVTIAPSAPAQSQTATCSFRLREVYGAPITIGRVACTVTDLSGNVLFDFPVTDNLTVPAGGMSQYSASALINLAPGSYRAVARMMLTTSWADVKAIGSGVNPRAFTVPGTPTNYTLTVATSGSGTVTGSQIDCGTACTGVYMSGASVALTPRPSSSTFTRWEGDCTGTGSCSVSMTRDRFVRAVFSSTPVPVAPSSLAATTVSASQINLSWTDNSSNETGFKLERKAGSSGSWSQIATPGQNITSFQDTGRTASTTYFYRVRASNASGDSSFSNETSATTSGTTADYELRLSKEGNGSGTVVSTPAGINCGSSCQTASAPFPGGQPVSLTPIAAQGSTFTGWSGDCTGSTNPCSVTINGAKSVVATFTIPAALNPPSSLKAEAPLGPNNNQMILTWVDNSSSETGFRIERSKDGSDTSWMEVTATARDATSYRDFNLDPFTTYFYRVRAIGPSGDSADSNQAGENTGGGFLIWPVPIKVPGSLSQGYGSFNFGAANQHHSGLDLRASGNKVVAAAGGTVRVWLLSEHQNKSHCLGNVVMIDHGATSTLYAHLASVDSFVSGNRNAPVSKGQVIGISGDTVGKRNDGSDCVGLTGPHLHFELKNESFLGATGDDDLLWGYTPEQGVTGQLTPAHVPDSFGFRNPIPNLARIATRTPTVTVTVTAAADGFRMRLGPTAAGEAAIVGTVVAGQQYLAIREAASAPAEDQCNGGWLELTKTDGSYFASGSASFPTVWVCKGNAGVTYLQEGTSPLTYTLTVSRIGSGVGTVTSSPSGINNCGGTSCSFDFARNSSVTLTPFPGSNSTFGSWSGCTSTSGNTCAVTMNGNKNVSVSFNSSPTTRTLIVTKTGSGSAGGTVTSSPSGINCGSACSAPYEINRSVTLTASVGSSTTFSGWGSGCSSTSGNTCVVSMSSDKTISATFNANPTQVRERLQNTSFTSGISSWSRSGDFWAGTNLSNYRTRPGYAAGGVSSSGAPKNNAFGTMLQSFSIPANATTAELSFYANVTSDAPTSSSSDFLNVTLQDSSGNFLASVRTLSNRDKVTSPNSYLRYPLNLLPYKGRTLRIHFFAFTDSSLPTTFRIDDVSVMADGN